MISYVFEFEVLIPLGVTDLPCSSRILNSTFSFIVTNVLTDIALVAKSNVEYDSSY